MFLVLEEPLCFPLNHSRGVCWLKEDYKSAFDIFFFGIRICILLPAYKSNKKYFCNKKRFYLYMRLWLLFTADELQV